MKEQEERTCYPTQQSIQQSTRHYVVNFCTTLYCSDVYVDNFKILILIKYDKSKILIFCSSSKFFSWLYYLGCYIRNNPPHSNVGKEKRSV
jgi:hypothetical protein